MAYSATVGSLLAVIQNITQIYTVSDDAIVANDAVQTHNDLFNWYKQKEITLIGMINPVSRFRFVFEIQRVNPANVDGQIYRNGVAVGTLQSTVGAGYEVKTEDINIQLDQYDTIELWTLGNVNVQNFRLRGTPSQFENTLGA